MTYEPVLPTPLRHKIAGWNLPRSVELELLESVRRQLESSSSNAGDAVHTFEFSASDGVAGYDFFVWFRSKIYQDKLAIVDMDITPVDQ